MLSKILTRAFFLLPAVVITAAQTSRAQEAALSCPAVIMVDENPEVLEGWQGSGGKVRRFFERISIYNGEPGWKEYELAPDESRERGRKVTQVWPLKGYRDLPLFLRCRYRDTPAVLLRKIPEGIEACRFVFELDGKSRITGKPAFSCR